MHSPTTSLPTPPSTPAAPPRVAIVGCGPSGCYTTQALLKRIPDAQVTVFDALPTPYGLIRHGIAPDHQGAKAVQKQFDRLFAREHVEFVGNTVIGRDIPLTALLDSFHAVVFATGLARDRTLGVAEEPGTRVVGAGQLLRLLNSDPDSVLREDPSGIAALGDEIALVGTGNVAIDVARLLSKSHSEMAASDIDDDAHASLRPSPISSIHVIGRCRADAAKWDPSMLKELSGVESVSLYIDGEPYDGEQISKSSLTRIDVHFQQIVESVSALRNRTRLTTHHSENPSHRRHFDVDTIIAAVGFEEPLNRQAESADHLRPNVFRVGGSASGRLGNLAENRKLAAAVAADVAEFLGNTAPLTDRTDLVTPFLPAQRVSFEGWQKIDAAETLRASPQRCRTKFTTRAELLAAAQLTAPAANSALTSKDS
ncbi:oxidoreductase [Rhodococcoides fascians]|uniref:oxidoreductase n=1 Tax=Rhodococcoides fascians TaxID=1828 RepID=UPI00278B826F|nr:oxidoreductase [Rhodococcus fascians]MDQ0283954.1 ferredoxin--NADP+ reductase [Rhodococcus fascians]